MTVTSPSDGAAGRRGAAGGAGREQLPEAGPSPRTRRRESVLTLPPAPRSRQHARRVVGPDPSPRRRPPAPGVVQPSLFPTAPPVPAPPVPAPPAVRVPAASPRPAGHVEQEGVPAPVAPSALSAPLADERWSREWMAERRRQRQARLGVGVALIVAAGLTVLALVTARSPTSAGQPTPSLVLTPGPAVGTAGLVPAPQPPPAGSGTVGAATP